MDFTGINNNKSPSFKKIITKFWEDYKVLENKNKSEKIKIKFDLSISSQWQSSSDDKYYKDLKTPEQA